MRPAKRLVASLAIGLLAPALVVAVPEVAQAAAGCDGRTGIVVVVDYAELGGGVVKGCDPDGGNAANNFTQAGFDLTRATRDPSFVCRVAGKPASDPCVNAAPANAFWSLWWSDGTSGNWVFSTDGVSTLNVPEGGYVAFAWHQGDGRASAPAVVPTPRQAVAPAPSSTKPTKAPATKKPNGAKSSKPKPSASVKPSVAASSATTTPTEASTSATPSASTATPSESPSATQVETPSQTTSTGLPSIDEITDGPDTTAADASKKDDGGGFPAWLGIGLVVVVLGAAGAVPILRRRNG